MSALGWGVVSLIDAFEGTSSCSTSAPLAANLRFWSGVIAILTVGAIVREWPRAAVLD